MKNFSKILFIALFLPCAATAAELPSAVKPQEASPAQATPSDFIKVLQTQRDSAENEVVGLGAQLSADQRFIKSLQDKVNELKEELAKAYAKKPGEK